MCSLFKRYGGLGCLGWGFAYIFCELWFLDLCLGVMMKDSACIVYGLGFRV